MEVWEREEREGVEEGGWELWERKGGRCGRRIAMGHRKERDMDEGGGSGKKGRWELGNVRMGGWRCVRRREDREAGCGIEGGWVIPPTCPAVPGSQWFPT